MASARKQFQFKKLEVEELCQEVRGVIIDYRIGIIG